MAWGNRYPLVTVYRGFAAPFRRALRGFVAVHNSNERRLAADLVYNFTASHRHEETSHMSIQAHLAELEKKHQALEEELNEALAHPSTDDLKIAELKRRKLQVKDEMARLRQDVSVH
jgi:hypothetical protein